MTSFMRSIAIPPATDVEPVRQVLHGSEIVDEYRWLEGSDAPEIGGADPVLDARVSAWTDSQNAFTREVLDHLPGRPLAEARLRELIDIGQVSQPVARRDRYFFWRREPGQAQWTVVLRVGVQGPERTLLDPNLLESDGLTALGAFFPNHDGTLAAFTLFKAGDENTTLYLLEVDSGRWLAEEIPGKVDAVSWLPDSTAFLYHRLADVANPYSRQVRLHTVGTHHRQDPVLVEQEKEGPLATTWGPFASLSRDGRWMILGYWTGTDSNDLWAIDFDRWLRTGELSRREIVRGEEALTFGEVVGDTLFLRTNLGAPNGRVFAVDLNNPERSRWKEILPERPDAVLEELRAARGILAAQYLENASSRVLLVRYDGLPLGELELPDVGTASVSTNEDRTEAFLSFTSFDHPLSIYRVDLATGERQLWARPVVPGSTVPIETRQVWYLSKDGTRVSMFVVHKKDLPRDGKNPTILNGYGGFGLSVTPSFRPTVLPWIEAGGVYAFPNLRGGGEYGAAWHRAGMLERKQNVFDDMIAAAEWLIAEGYTRPANLAIRGGSNGGLLAGAALVQRPELFAAVVCAVPLLDMVRYHHFLMGRYWAPEYGTSESPEQLAFLLEYSPYHNVVKGVRYPAVLLTAGENDVRVHPLHARKMAARLQAASGSDQQRHPVLLWVDRSAGHGRGKPVSLQIQDLADEFVFLQWQLGLGAEAPLTLQLPEPVTTLSAAAHP